MATQLIRPIVGLAAATMGEKVNIPGDIVSNITRIEGNQTMGSDESQIHIQALEHFDERVPATSRLLQSRRPELE